MVLLQCLHRFIFFLTKFISHYFKSYILGRRLFVSVYVHVSVNLYMCVEGRTENCPRKDISVLRYSIVTISQVRSVI